MFGPIEAKLFEAFFWLAGVALFVRPLLSHATPLGGWQDQAEWLASSAVGLAAGLLFTVMRIRPEKPPQMANIATAIVVLLVFLLCLQALRWL